MIVCSTHFQQHSEQGARFKTAKIRMIPSLLFVIFSKGNKKLPEKIEGFKRNRVLGKIEHVLHTKCAKKMRKPKTRKEKREIW